MDSFEYHLQDPLRFVIDPPPKKLTRFIWAGDKLYPRRTEWFYPEAWYKELRTARLGRAPYGRAKPSPSKQKWLEFRRKAAELEGLRLRQLLWEKVGDIHEIDDLTLTYLRAGDEYEYVQALRATLSKYGVQPSQWARDWRDPQWDPPNRQIVYIMLDEPSKLTRG